MFRMREEIGRWIIQILKSKYEDAIPLKTNKEHKKVWYCYY